MDRDVTHLTQEVENLTGRRFAIASSKRTQIYTYIGILLIIFFLLIIIRPGFIYSDDKKINIFRLIFAWVIFVAIAIFIAMSYGFLDRWKFLTI